MKWIRIFSAVVATIGLTATAQAGLFGHGSCKSSGCADTCQPECCAPVITRPCNVNVFTYQRKCSDIKPPCCDTCCPTACCAPKKSLCDRLFGGMKGHGHGGDECCPAPTCCQPTAPVACAPQGCAPQGCCPQSGCRCGKKSWFSFGKGGGLFGSHHHDECCAPAATCCGPQACVDTGCCDTGCCNADPCEIAKLIYQSQTACYADDREDAIEDLGNNYSCVCNPEIMSAMIYALNDADEGVRKQAADEIGDQLRDNPCCCSADITSALTCALADCDRGVRHQAEEALEACGYQIVDGCCDTCCDTTGCAPNGCAPYGAPAGNAPSTAPAPAEDGAPAPAPPADPKAYFPRRVQPQQASAPKSTHRLAALFGLAK